MGVPVRILAVAALVIVLSPAFAQSPQGCLVYDSEINKNYQGGCKDGKAEGFGTARGSATYVGEFKEGRKNGKGVQAWESGNRYEGEFFQDLRHGKGIFTFGEKSIWAGQRYEGDFFEDAFNGLGVYTWPWGDRYSGPFKDGNFAGDWSPMMLSRYRAHVEAIRAMEKPGLKLCREASKGIGLKEQILATTVAVNAARQIVSVRITKLGQVPLVIAGSQVKEGDTVWDDPLNWTPCL
jgi:hypothetical protein